MKKKLKKNITERLRKARVRAAIRGTATFPRLSVFRSNTALYVQIIDDSAGKTLASANFKEIKEASKKPLEKAILLGKLVAEKAKKVGISQVVFDRSGYSYHGRIKAIADGAREGGLKF